jgi:hypothetical protein
MFFLSFERTYPRTEHSQLTADIIYGYYRKTMERANNFAKVVFWSVAEQTEN